ncbi:MAG: NHLP leader peptide family natural product precursor [Deltaproteobacteria bacterium]|nr:NHLP leader peptide family natural product precursor [Deltaproteobacteria bacterium]
MAANPVKQAIVRACTDAAYRARLLSDPRKALAEEGIEVPADIEVRVHENTDNKIVAVLPGPQAAELRERTKQLPSGPVVDVPSGLGLEWQQTALIATGRIDTNTAPALRRELLRAFTDVDLVLSGVTFLSSPGLAALLAGQKHLATYDSHLRLCDVPVEIRNVLEMVGFLDLFEIVNRSSLDDPYVAALMAMPFH